MHIVGARPNFMKAAPVVEAAMSLDEEPILIHTGQHYDAELSGVFFNQLGLPKPTRDLGVGSGSHAAQTAKLLVALEEALIEYQPPALVVYGDINSTLAATIAASKLEIPTAHVEAGLRSFDRTMPEEINRVVTDALCELHFVTSPEAMAHLANEGIAAHQMHFVGNPMIDTLLRFRDALDPDSVRRSYSITGNYGVVTLHRPSNVDDIQTARRVVSALHRVADDLPLLVPLHPRGRAALEYLGLGAHDSIMLTSPMGYLEFMALVVGSSLVLTDSGGIQEETTVLGVPCITIRENTERPITVTMGSNSLAGTDPDRITALAKTKLSTPPNSERPPLWDGAAGMRIARILNRWDVGPSDHGVPDDSGTPAC
ncbi:UDP-N-acetylglucosamine 2-epimerase (non-hydrolyzing) [soil metagenome]